MSLPLGKAPEEVTAPILFISEQLPNPPMQFVQRFFSSHPSRYSIGSSI